MPVTENQIILIVGFSACVILFAILFFRQRSVRDDLDATWLIEAHNAKQASKDEIQSLKLRLGKQQLQAATWDQITKTLNPSGDGDIAALILKLRGPHMFAPEVALNILDHCCEQLLSSTSDASIVDVFEKAVQESERITSSR